MPDISLLEPMMLAGVVEKFVTPESLTLLSRIPQEPHPFPSVTWDVIQGSRMVGAPNVPNAEAHIVSRLGRSQESAAFIYYREKKVFNPTTLYYLREAGEINRVNAEKAVLREVADLNQRVDNLQEYCLWQALTGTLTLDFPDVQAVVDYKLPASHTPQVAVSWATATPAQIVADITAWKRLVQRDGRVPAREAFTSELTMGYIFNSFATTGVATTFMGGTLLSDRMKDKYYTSGTLPGFMGLDWNPIETVYDDSSGNQTQFVPDKAIFLGNYTDQRPIKMKVGPTADLDAPQGYTGKFSKTWIEPDPSARQYMLELSFLPIIERPEQMVYVADITDTP